MFQTLLRSVSNAAVAFAKMCWTTSFVPLLYIAYRIIETFALSIRNYPSHHITHIMLSMSLFYVQVSDDFRYRDCAATAAMAMVSYFQWNHFQDIGILCWNVFWLLWSAFILSYFIYEKFIDGLGDEHIELLYQKYFQKYNVTRKRFRKLLRSEYVVKGELRVGDAFALAGFPAGNRMAMLLFGQVELLDENNHPCGSVSALQVLDMFKPTLNNDISTIYKVTLLATRCSAYIYWEYSSLKPLLKKDMDLNDAVTAIMREYSIDNYMTTNLQATRVFEYQNVSDIARYDDPVYQPVLQLLSLEYNSIAAYRAMVMEVIQQQHKEGNKVDNVKEHPVKSGGNNTD